jgi:SPP1 gp7 family putative phage head morphogenesis protein
MAIATIEPLPPEEAIAAFRRKGNVPSFAWQDLWQEEHASAFTVAKALRLDVLQDLRDGVDAAIVDGITFGEFKKRLKPLLVEKGWWGKAQMEDPLSGEMRTVQLGSPRRLRIIFDTNLRTSYAAGRWQQIQEVKEARPYLRYVAILDGRTRPQHRAWHGTILPVDSEWWTTNYPPNGWRCRCTVQQLSRRDLEREGFEVSDTPPPGGTRIYTNPRTGISLEVPEGIDPGFAYNPGVAAARFAEDERRRAVRLLAEKAGGAAPELAAQAMPTAAELTPGYQAWFDAVRGSRETRLAAVRALGEQQTVGTLPLDAVAFLEGEGGRPERGGITVAARRLGHALRDTKGGAGKAVPPELLRELPRLLEEPQAILYQVRTRRLLYVVPAPGDRRAAKLVIEIDRAGNRFDTAGLVDLATLRSSDYKLVKGEL